VAFVALAVWHSHSPAAPTTGPSTSTTAPAHPNAPVSPAVPVKPTGDPRGPKLTEIGQAADGFFKSLEGQANQAIDKLASDLGDRTFGSSVTGPASAWNPPNSTESTY
jgi:hypothetical protein